MYKQVKLSRENIHTVSWVDTEKKFKLGDYIRFKNENEWWRVDKICDGSLEKKDIKRDWRVGGL